MSSRNFNPRSRVGSDHRYLRVDDFFPISIRAPAWGATLPVLFRYVRFAISIRAPTRGATRGCVFQPPALGNFNPRSHEGSDNGLLESAVIGGIISIRAPTRGATANSEIILTRCAISIRAPTRGATIPVGKYHCITGNFNPRSHEGSDVCYNYII